MFFWLKCVLQAEICPCSPVVKALSGRGSHLSSVMSAYQRIISNNSYTHTHDEQGDIPGQQREGWTVSSINCDRC